MCAYVQSLTDEGKRLKRVKIINLEIEVSDTMLLTSICRRHDNIIDLLKITRVSVYKLTIHSQS